MNNPFDVIEQRLNKLEMILTNLGELVISSANKNNDPTNNNLIKIDEAVEITGYKRGYIYELVHRNVIPFIKRGRSVRFDREELENWMRAERPNIIQETIKRLR